MASSGATSAAYLDLDNDGVPDVKIQLVQFTEKGRLSSDTSGGIEFDSNPGFSLGITILNPKSAGTLSIGESNENTIVKPNIILDLKMKKEMMPLTMKNGKKYLMEQLTY